MFSTGDCVVYGTNGVCRIEEIKAESFEGSVCDYYVLRPLTEGSSTTIFIPVNRENLVSQMLPLLSRDKIHSLLEDFPLSCDEWIENNKLRADSFREILSSGDRRRILRLIHTIRCHRESQEEKGRRLHVVDDTVLQKAESMILGEIACSLNITREEALSLILRAIEKKES